MGTNPPIIIVMGVSSSGKSTVGRLLAKRLGIPFADADDYHPQGNIKKMEAGEALNDEDRYLWLVDLNRAILEAQETGIVLACSALKEKYRELMREGVKNEFIWAYLDGSYEEILERMRKREDHFMPSSLLISQFETMEVPPYALKISIAHPPETIVEHIVQELKRPS